MPHLPGTRFTNINFDPNMDKYAYDECGIQLLIYCKLQRLHHRSLGMDE